MADEPTIGGGWLPPSAPGGKPPPRFDRPSWPRPHPPEPPPQPPSEPPRPTFAPAAPVAANATAAWALGFGIAGLLLLLLSLGTLFLVTLPCSVVAWVLAGSARRRIERGE